MIRLHTLLSFFLPLVLLILSFSIHSPTSLHAAGVRAAAATASAKENFDAMLKELQRSNVKKKIVDAVRKVPEEQAELYWTMRSAGTQPKDSARAASQYHVSLLRHPWVLHGKLQESKLFSARRDMVVSQRKVYKALRKEAKRIRNRADREVALKGLEEHKLEIVDTFPDFFMETSEYTAALAAGKSIQDALVDSRLEHIAKQVRKTSKYREELARHTAAGTSKPEVDALAAATDYYVMERPKFSGAFAQFREFGLTRAEALKHSELSSLRDDGIVPNIPLKFGDINTRYIPKE